MSRASASTPRARGTVPFLILAATTLVLPVAAAPRDGASAGPSSRRPEAPAWEVRHRLIDVRLDRAWDVAGELATGPVKVELPSTVAVGGLRHDVLEVGTGWIRFLRHRALAELAEDGTTIPSAERASRGPRVDVLAGPAVALAAGSRVLVVRRADGVVVRWTGLLVEDLGEAAVEVLIDRLGEVTVQYLALPPGTAASVESGRVRAGAEGPGALSPARATAYSWRQPLLERSPPSGSSFTLHPRPGGTPAGRPPEPRADGPPPAGCEPAPEDWCRVADGPGETLVYLAEGFDDGDSASRGWSGTDQWHEIDFATCPPGATADPGRSWYFGSDGTCSYANGSDGTLTSPAVGPVTAGTSLTFNLRLAKEEGFPVPFDTADVLVNGTLVASYSSPPDPDAWFAVVPIPLADPPSYDFTGEMVTIGFRFRSDDTVTGLGWLVDDVLLWDPNGADADCVVNAGLGGFTPCEERSADQWDFNEEAFCQACPYTFYALVECGREMHLPLDDMEGADVRVTDLLTGEPASLRCINQTARAEAGEGDFPSRIQAECCADPGVETWWGPAFDETDNAGAGRVAWGFPDCPDVGVYDTNGDAAIACSELPGCGGVLDLVSPGEEQVMDCSISADEGLCGIYRIDVLSGGFVWSLFANCDGTDTPQFPIFFDCTEAWEAFEPLPELALSSLEAEAGCPSVPLVFDVQNIGCADFEGDVPVRVISSCDPPDVMDAVVPGPVPAGESVAAALDFPVSCGPVDVEVLVDPDDVVVECTESPTAAACRAAEGVDSLSITTCTCAPSITSPPEDAVVCAGGTVMLDGSGVGFESCAGTVEREWDDGSSVVGTGPTLSASPPATTTYTVTATCTADPSCVARASATVEVHAPPELGAVFAEDFAPCNEGIDVSWDAADFHGPTGTGVYNVYRSEIDCADALSSPPLVSGLVATGWFDESTVSGRSYVYVVEAEDERTATPCSPVGADHGGAVARACTSPAVADVAVPAFPDGVDATLRVRHAGDTVTLTWEDARALEADEHFHVLKARGSATDPFFRANPEGDLSRSWSETDETSPLQFFDLRVANVCEQQSEDEFPPG